LLQLRCILQVTVVAAGKGISHRPINSCTGEPGEQNAPTGSPPPPRRPSPYTRISPAKPGPQEDAATSSQAPPQRNSPEWGTSSST
jgi:hypothetical protein